MHTVSVSRMAIMTDIHFGARSNSVQHCDDSLRYIDWFVDQVKADPLIDAIGFLGDWHENRSALNIHTLNVAFEGARRINDIGLPVYFTIGNHDLYHRHSRAVHSVPHFDELTNFIMVTEPTVFTNDSGDDFMMCPYIFHEEYPGLAQYLNVPVWMGHFEFKGFIVTGQGRAMPTGPEADDFKGPKIIMSGHFHKRQADKNVVYIGNTFPSSFGDAGDDARGMCIYDFGDVDTAIVFKDWAECPKYRKCKLSDISEGTVELQEDMRVKCIVDVAIDFDESTAIREQMIKQFKLREFTLEESVELRESITETESGIDWEQDQLAGIDELVSQMLGGIESPTIDNDLLVSIYDQLK